MVLVLIGLLVPAGLPVAQAGDPLVDAVDFAVVAPRVGGVHSGILVGGYSHHADSHQEGRIVVLKELGGPVVWEKQGEQSGLQLGERVWSGFDTNGDGIGDFAVRASPPASGRQVRFYESTKGGLWEQRWISSGGHDYGVEVAEIGDVLGSPEPEFLIAGNGRFWVVSLEDDSATVVAEHTADAKAGGYSQAVVADLNRDGSQEVVLSRYDPVPLDAEVIDFVHVYTLDRPMQGSIPVRMVNAVSRPAGNYFGYSLAILADLDGDAWSDIAIGQPHWNRTGRVVLWSPGTGSVRSIEGVHEGEAFGCSLLLSQGESSQLLIGARGAVYAWSVSEPGPGVLRALQVGEIESEQPLIVQQIGSESRFLLVAGRHKSTDWLNRSGPTFVGVGSFDHPEFGFEWYER